MHTENPQKLGLEVVFLVMLDLVSDVLLDCRLLRLADREHGIAFLHESSFGNVSWIHFDNRTLTVRIKSDSE